MRKICIEKFSWIHLSQIKFCIIFKWLTGAPAWPIKTGGGRVKFSKQSELSRRRLLDTTVTRLFCCTKFTPACSYKCTEPLVTRHRRFKFSLDTKSVHCLDSTAFAMLENEYISSVSQFCSGRFGFIFEFDPLHCVCAASLISWQVLPTVPTKIIALPQNNVLHRIYNTQKTREQIPRLSPSYACWFYRKRTVSALAKKSNCPRTCFPLCAIVPREESKVYKQDHYNGDHWDITRRWNINLQEEGPRHSQKPVLNLQC